MVCLCEGFSLPLHMRPRSEERITLCSGSIANRFRYPIDGYLWGRGCQQLDVLRCCFE